MLNISTTQDKIQKKKNRNGIAGGLGYLGASVLAGIGNVGEGAIDAIIAPLADLTGNHALAESVFKNNHVGDWYRDVTEDYNPGGFMEFLGNVSQGIGQSAYLFIPCAGAPIFFSGIMAQSISGAAEQTGDVGLKEAAYGLTTGAVEAGLEHIGGAAVKGAKAIASGGIKNAAKNAVRKGLISQILSDAASEFAEEAMSEVIDTGLQRVYNINPDAKLSVRDVLYAGAVGAVSGGITTTVVQVGLSRSNQKRGEKIIKNGNSQTLVNTATSVADKLAAQGTNWKRAPEWVKALRGQVDAYNKLSAEAKSGLRGQTILGEMQSSLYFAETQAIFDARQKQIQEASEQDRATWAEYINLNYDKSRRNNKDYTAADIANNTDNVAWQLAVFSYVPTMFNLDAAVVDYDAAQESGIADVVEKNQGAESGAAVGTNESVVGTEQYDLKEALTTLGDYDSDRRRHIESNPNDKISRNYDEIAEFINTASKQNPVKRLHIGVVNPGVADLAKKKANVDITDYDFVIASNFIAHIFDEHGNEKTEATRGQKAVDKSNIEDIIETVIQPDDVSSTTDNQGNKALKFEKDINGRNVAITITSTKKGTLTLKSAWIINKNSGGRTPPASANTLAGTSKTSGRSSTDSSIHQNETIVNPEAKENSSNDAIDEKGKNSRSEAVEVEGEQTGAETVQDETAGASPRPTGESGGKGEVIDGATSSSTVSDGPPKSDVFEENSQLGEPSVSSPEKADLERAKRDAERMIEWEKKNAPNAKELDTVRGYVKNFDSLPADRQLAIVRMMRSSEGVNVDTVRGVANLMAITNSRGQVLAPDLEFRFAEFGKGSTRRGIKTEVGGKTVIVLNTNSTYKDTIRGTIAHEIVHYLENRKGYKTLAEFAMKHAKAEKVAEVRETYKDVYKGENAEAKIKGEVVASVVAELLGSEKFLKRYAQMGEEQGSVVKRIAKFVKGIANALKEKDEGVSREAQKLMLLIDRALLSQQLETENQNEADTKYDIGSKTEEKTAPPFDKESDAVLYLSENNKEFKELSEKWVSLSKDEKEGQVGKKIEARQKELIDSVMAKSPEQTKDSDTSTKKPPKKKAKKPNSQKKERQSKEQAAKKAVDALFADTVRTYTKSEFRSIFERVKSIAPENLGKIIEGKTVGMRGSDIDQMLSDVYIAMYQASYKGNVGAVEAIREIARSAAKYYIEHQSVYNQEENKYVSLKRYIDDADILKSYEDALVEELYKSFAEAGRDLSNYRNLSFIRKQMEQYRSKYLNFKEMTKYRKRASDSAMDLKHLANTQKRAAADEGVRLLAKAMGDTVDKHGNVRVQKIDAAIAHASDFYNAETNTKFFGEENSESLVDYAQKFDRRIRENLDILIEMRKDRQGKPLTMMEMKLWAEILGGMRATINEYNGLYLQSKWFDRTQVAMDLANNIVDFFGYQADKNPKNKFLGGLSNVARKINEDFFYSVLTPEAVIEGLEGYAAKGILKTFFRSVRDATQLAEKQYFELVMPFTDFFESKENSWQDGKKTYKYDEKLENKKIDLFGNEITLGEAIYTYGLTKREHAQAGLAGEGIKIYDKDGRIKKHIREIDAERAREWLYNQFDETDKKFVEIVENFFNKTSTEIKERSDLEYLGYTNTIEGYYIPILRDRLSRDARTTDKRSTIFDTITVYNERFNKNTVKNSKPCEVTNITSVISMHAKGLADYANLYMPLKSFDRLYNSPVVLADGRNTTIREILNDVWPDSKNYLSDLFGDIQGISRKTGNFDTINELAQKLTDKWVPSVLSANVSVVLTQTTSYVAAFQDIEMRYLTRALGIVGRNWSELAERADKYSKITLARNSDQGAMRAQTNVEKVGKIGKILGVPTEWTDRQIVLLIYHACELKAEAEGAGQIGSEANAKRAAELCDQTIYDTQSMTSRAERSAWQRSPNLFARAITQFTSDSMKQLSHLYTNIMKYFAHSKRAKMNPNDTTYKAMLGKDRKAILRSATTVAATSAAMAGVAWAIRMLFNTVADEPEEEWSTVGWDFVGNVIGIIPLVSDIYDLFKDGYDITPTSMEIVNDTVTYFRDAIDVLGAATRGEYLSSEDIIKPTRNTIHSLATFAGAPIKPIEKTVVGLVRRVSPSSTYWWDSMFSPSSYTKDLQNALNKGDEKMASAVLETLWKNDINSAYVEEELLEIMRLYQIVDENGEYRDEVLPNRIPDIKSAKQRAQFEEIYGKASGAVIQLINSLEYQNLTDEERIVAISNTYKLWYDTAKSTVLNEEITNGQAYAKLLQDTSNLFIAQSKKKFMTPYKTLRGKEVTVKEQLSKYLDEMEINDTERLIIMYALGYRSKENKTKLLAYINSLNMSKNDLTQIANRLGFQVVDGKMKEVEEELEVRAE